VTYVGYQIIARFWTGVKIESAQPHQLKNHTVAFGAQLKKFKKNLRSLKTFLPPTPEEILLFLCNFGSTYLIPCRGSG
jgi:hypothetical protein